MRDEEVLDVGQTEEEKVEEVTIEVEVTEESEKESEKKSEKEEQAKGEKKEKPGSHLKDALKQVENFGQALSEALQGRGNVVMVRVNDEALDHLDMLVEAEITKSRSESAAFLIAEGINANEALFNKISTITDQIAELREQLRQEVKLAPEDEEEAATDDEAES
jgi:hypothetical protein